MGFHCAESFCCPFPHLFKNHLTSLCSLLHLKQLLASSDTVGFHCAESFGVFEFWFKKHLFSVAFEAAIGKLRHGGFSLCREFLLPFSSFV